jgi:5'-nucleotidase
MTQNQKDINLNILLTNDDGIEAEGIRRLAEALAEDHDVYVIAPHTQRSASGHAITIGCPVVIEEASFPGVRKAYSLEGTPADCVKMGVAIYRQEGIAIDKVFSGINHGGNMGTDTIYSGTVAAALEASVCRLPSVALSINARKPRQYETAQLLARRAAAFDFAPVDPVMVLNINVPDIPKEEIKGVNITKLGPREYHERFERSTDADGRVQYEYSGYPVVYDDFDADSNDVGAHQEGYVSVTPIHFDLTNHALIEKLKRSGFADIL